MNFWEKTMGGKPIEEFAIPGNVVFVPVDEMGRPGVPGVPGVHMEAFVAGTEPRAPELPDVVGAAGSPLSATAGSRDSEPGPDRR
jgi:hypothetical protein